MEIKEEELMLLTSTEVLALCRKEQFSRVKACITVARREGRRERKKRERVYTCWN